MIWILRIPKVDDIIFYSQLEVLTYVGFLANFEPGFEFKIFERENGKERLWLSGLSPLRFKRIRFGLL